MLYSCTHMATVGVKGLSVAAELLHCIMLSSADSKRVCVICKQRPDTEIQTHRRYVSIAFAYRSVNTLRYWPVSRITRSAQMLLGLHNEHNTDYRVILHEHQST